ncbi:MAG: PaaI family thioesterase [Leptospiraceae bacterium]|nr:PaaI family thioesterase [Leptospiraceae bacterium]
MEGRLESYEPGRSLRVSFPVKPEYNNPMHRMQGGMIAAAIDNTMGPLSLLVSRGAAVTLSMNLDYVRGIAEGKRLYVVASVVSRSRTNLIMEAVASDERGKMVARSTAQFQLFRMPASK